MSVLPFDQAITRFTQNEDRMDTFTNATGTYTTSTGDTVKTMPQLENEFQAVIDAKAASPAIVGNNGWTPVFAVVTDGTRRVLQVSTWTGGQGTTPAAGQYVGTTGLVSTAAAAVDIRGPAGADGAAGTNGTNGTNGTSGTNGWSPSFAVVADGTRRVLQVNDWTGGTGTKPTTGQYVGATGLTGVLASAVDIRGAAGTPALTQVTSAAFATIAAAGAPADTSIQYQVTDKSPILTYQWNGSAWVSLMQASIDSAGNFSGLVDPNTGAIVKIPATGNKVAIFGNSLARFSMPTDTDSSVTGYPAHGTPTAIALNAAVSPKVIDMSNGYAPLRYRCTTAGTTSGTEPVWPLVAGQTVTDGTVVWTAEDITSTASPVWGMGHWTLGQAMSGQRLDEVFMIGRSGEKCSQILAYFDRAEAVNPDVYFFMNMFENDCGISPTVSAIQAAWDLLFSKMERARSKNKKVMVATVLPNGNIDASSAFTGYSAGIGTRGWNWLNRKIREYAGARRDVRLVDWAESYTDPNPANPIWPDNAATFTGNSLTTQQTKYSDGVHPYFAGKFLLANVLASAIIAEFPPVNRFGNASDTYTLTPNPKNAGTGGTNVYSGGTPSGTVSAGKTLTMFQFSGTGGTLVASQVARTDSVKGNWQRAVATMGGSAIADNLDYTNTANISLGANFAIGDVVQSFSEVRVIASGLTLLSYIQNRLRFNGAGTNKQWSYSQVMSSAGDQDMGQFITQDTTFVFKTLPLQIPTSTTSINTYTKAFNVGNARTGSAWTIDFGRESIVRLSGNQPASKVFA